MSAALLVEQGYEVVGAFMKNWSGRSNGEVECGWKAERRDAARVAAQLGIPFVTLDFEEQYRAQVIENLFEESRKGRTPNPDVLCNKYVKFDLFVKEADRLECDFVATGHYARVVDGMLVAGADDNKDQTDFLWAIDPEVVGRILFPIGEMEKPAVREKARELGLPVAEKKDSTGICFVGEVDMRAFLQQKLEKDPGPIVTVEGEVIGEHEGINFYTIGQRHGLGVGGGTPYYVVEKRPETKELVVASNFHPALYQSELVIDQTNWFVQPEAGATYRARIRYRQALQDVTLHPLEEDWSRVRCVFPESQRAVTSGQSVVVYDGDVVVGGGIIE